MGFELKDNTILIGKGDARKREPISFLPGLEEKHPGYQNKPYEFTGLKGEKADGTLFIIYPTNPDGTRNAISVVRNLTENVFEETAIEGEAFWLAQSPKGDVLVYEVNKGNLGTTIEWHGKGWVNVWIGGKKGGKVLDITEPKFVLGETEEEVPIDHPSVSLEFWEEYHRLTKTKPSTKGASSVSG